MNHRAQAVIEDPKHEEVEEECCELDTERSPSYTIHQRPPVAAT